MAKTWKSFLPLTRLYSSAGAKRYANDGNGAVCYRRPPPGSVGGVTRAMAHAGGSQGHGEARTAPVQSCRPPRILARLAQRNPTPASPRRCLARFVPLVSLFLSARFGDINRRLGGKGEIGFYCNGADTHTQRFREFLSLSLLVRRLISVSFSSLHICLRLSVGISGMCSNLCPQDTNCQS